MALTDYLLGQADPIGRADAVRHLRNDPADRELAERLCAQLLEIAPDAELPRLPTEGRTAPHLRAPHPASAREWSGAAAPRPPADPRRTRLFMALGSGGLVLVVVVLAVAGVFSGGSEQRERDPDDRSSSTTTGGSAANNSDTITPLKLKPVGGGPGSGVATFGLATGDTPFLDVRISGLPQPGNGQVYAAWLVVDTSKRVGYPLAPLVPYPASGPYHDSFNIPSPAIPLISGIQSIDITTAPAKQLANEIQSVISNKKNPKIVLPIVGSTVLRAIVPRGKASAAASASGGGSGSGQ